MRAPNPSLPRSAGLGLGAAALTLLLAATPATAIVGGREGAEVPGAASAVMVLTSGGGVCSGVVVAPDAVLTAGHCVAGVGENRVHYRDAAGRPVLAEVAARHLHPAYDGEIGRAHV